MLHWIVWNITLSSFIRVNKLPLFIWMDIVPENYLKVFLCMQKIELRSIWNGYQQNVFRNLINFIYMYDEDLPLNKLKWLICYNNEPNQTKENQTKACSFVCVRRVFVFDFTQMLLEKPYSFFLPAKVVKNIKIDLSMCFSKVTRLGEGKYHGIQYLSITQRIRDSILSHASIIFTLFCI